LRIYGEKLSEEESVNDLEEEVKKAKDGV